MKKTLNINIGNTIIHIEEDAYEKLTIYLNEVKHHFARNADDFEIVTDIENRIAEMFSEMLSSQQKQAISIDDVEKMIGQMGSVKDFETSEDDEPLTSHREMPPFSVKKLYRDRDQAMIAGVCVGLAHYLNIDARWVRLIALASIFLGGSGILVYIVLWIMVPKAETRKEKMAMHGEEPNLKGFANSHLQPLVKHSRGLIAEFFDVLGNFINGAGRILVKAIAIMIIVFGSFFLLSLIVLLAAFLGFWDANIYQYFPVSMVNEEYMSALTFATFIVFSIPLLALILFSVRAGFNGRPITKTLSFGLLIVWLAGVFSGIFYVAKISSEFKEGAEFSQSSELLPYKTYNLTVDRTRFFTKEDSVKYSIDAKHYKGRKILNEWNRDFDQPRNLRLVIEKSENGKVSLTQSYKARGSNFEAALKNAQNIHYDFLQNNADLNFSPYLQLVNKANWRGQEVILILKVPVGTQLNISHNFGRYLDGYSYWGCEHGPGNDYSEWIMSETGVKCKYEHEAPAEE